jgi:hypothetical protein
LDNPQKLAILPPILEENIAGQRYMSKLSSKLEIRTANANIWITVSHLLAARVEE